MNNQKVKFRYGTPVTQTSPPILPGSFIFDSSTLNLYLDYEDKRIKLTDQLTLTTEGGVLTGAVSIINNEGTTVSNFTTDGVVEGTYLETTGDIMLDHAAGLFAVIEDGRICARTADQVRDDLHIIDPSLLGKLAYKDSTSTIFTYTPEGTLKNLTAELNKVQETVIKDVTSSINASVSSERLTIGLNNLTINTTQVLKDISIDNITGTFEGTPITKHIFSD